MGVTERMTVTLQQIVAEMNAVTEVHNLSHVDGP